MFEVLPVLLIGPVAGFAADKMPRRRLMVSADIVRAAAAASLVVAAGSVPRTKINAAMRARQLRGWAVRARCRM